MGSAWIGEDLLRARLRLGVTRDEAAKQLGVEAETWLRWERGQCPPEEHAERLAEMIRDGLA